MLRPIRRAGCRTAAAVGILVLSPIIATTGAVSAGTTIRATYPVTGSTFIKAANFRLSLGPGTLASKVSLITGAITAHLSLPDATGSFKEAGLVPVTATTQFINDSPTTGKLNLNTGAVQTTSTITLRVTDLKVGGIDMPVGSACETSAPVTVKVASLPGFNVVNGGNLAGIYRIPPFANCRLETLLINLTIPGPGNTITLTLGPARQG